jgi:SAM-dependent methyltransferase
VNPNSRTLCEQCGIEFIPHIHGLGRTFDVVLAHHVLEHVDDPLTTLQSLRPLLAPGGRLLIFVPLERGRKFVRGEPNMHLYAWTPQTLGNLVERAGFTVASIRVAGYGYEQRLAPLARVSLWAYELALRCAWLVKPCEEIQLEAALSSRTNPSAPLPAGV